MENVTVIIYSKKCYFQKIQAKLIISVKEKFIKQFIKNNSQNTYLILRV